MDFCGKAFMEQVVRARSFLGGEAVGELRALATEKVDFFPEDFQERLNGMMGSVGASVVEGDVGNSSSGASSRSFDGANRSATAPLSGLGPYRIGENGRLYLTTKSEHYHASLGHGFPGYTLVERARRLGIPNATHNNTRGHITRVLERALVASANGLAEDDISGLEAVLERERLDVLNRVLNLETGSLALEAALKMILARFYRVQAGLDTPKYAGKTPVILVIGDDEGGPGANYHGTTILTQVMRGMWPEMAQRLEDVGAFRVEAVRPNNFDDLERVFRVYNTDTTQIAGFFHEIVMMNYGGLVLTQEFLQRGYALCAEHEVPTVCDEIQSCIWNPQIFMFREYGLRPTFVSVGKGFPGGEYPASRILFSAAMDNDLPQFGALVTNGQEELASLSYLITLRWAQANAEVTRSVGEYYTLRLRDLASRYEGLVTAVAGHGHMSSLYIRDLVTAKAIAAKLVEAGVDISAQTYKADCPPALLTKLPLIAGYQIVDFVVDQLELVLESFADAAVTR
jgi:acetylornithine/succinyldiaminopimelate/putrescine aminotransferase